MFIITLKENIVLFIFKLFFLLIEFLFKFLFKVLLLSEQENYTVYFLNYYYFYNTNVFLLLLKLNIYKLKKNKTN